ncbi:hypothetical protein [Helicobacter pylori]|uniref:hypothetical protein n=1 Tax=Helicobacter pylori TaxID=210 RepID=UPI0039E167CF
MQVLENNTMGRSLALALQKVSIPRPISVHRVPLINHFLEQVILQNQSDENKSIKPIAFGSVIKLNPHNRNPLLKPYSAFIALSCAQFHYSGMRQPKSASFREQYNGKKSCISITKGIYPQTHIGA